MPKQLKHRNAIQLYCCKPEVLCESERRELFLWMYDVYQDSTFMNFGMFLLGIIILLDTAAKVTIPRHQMQLYGIASLWLAEKFLIECDEHLFYASSCIYYTDGLYQISELLHAERVILQALDFNVWYNIPHTCFQPQEETLLYFLCMDPRPLCYVWPTYITIDQIRPCLS